MIMVPQGPYELSKNNELTGDELSEPDLIDSGVNIVDLKLTFQTLIACLVCQSVTSYNWKTV